ncbi:MAG TPA: CsgG/HfaB family protein [Bacteroidota bacterium]|nr:CsgG/HfaB family protein [Bacteroidota bacterium]
MLRPLVIILFSFAFLIGCGSSKKVVNVPRMNIAVMGFEARTGVEPGEAESVAEAFAAQLQQTGRFTVIDRKQMQTILQEQGFQAIQSGEAEASRAGKILSVRKMITGSMGKLGDKYIFSIKMTDVESSNIDVAISKTYDDDLEDIFEEFIPQLVQEILDTIDGKKKK